MNTAANDPREPSAGAGTATSGDQQQPQRDLGAFEAWRTKLTRMTGLGLSDEERMQVEAERAAATAEEQYRTCEKWKNHMIRHSPIVKFLMQHLEAAGCGFSRKHFICQPCDPTRSGGFSPEYGVVLCENQLVSKAHVEDTMAHELIHALDHCRAKLDWDNCLHHACTEIRAGGLSGDCRVANEWLRGKFRHHQAAPGSNPKCAGPGVAEEAVAEVWASCFADTWPFDEIYK
ncbi:hypothetical protein AMAG_02219 [Allomyces macrogynus ATCC 38327]|uniref:Mitochondrial inner membrane protease ATP23 n=1 Tax=Allomyces macrogynus (strain ATCC 38327) TaxID=578462 RepID=A0A0L0S1X4_ALLM3|nr:hypothetical protein AMAG_02219 [Allomyces macrogynus ATCC 38327]|eukprot:KNE56410.1 hypothetical protein AMAG_02219 [Allomyces macrogynus ATCC 38327]